MFDTIGKNHGHYQMEQNMVKVKKKTYGKKKIKGKTANKNARKNLSEKAEKLKKKCLT